MARPDEKPPKRVRIPDDVVRHVLTEAGYRCGVPTCRGILALDLHHMVKVSDGGKNEASNLLALCPTCHALHHRGTIPIESIRAWKATLVGLSQAFDAPTIDFLIFLHKGPAASIQVSGDGLVQCARALGSGLAEYRSSNVHQSPGPAFFHVSLSDRGKRFIDAWIAGDRNALMQTSGSIES